MSKTYSNLIDGHWVADSADHFEDLNPADLTEVVAEVPLMSAREATSAVNGAAAAYDNWRTMSAIDRGGILYEAARLLRERSVDISTDITREMGKTLAESTAEVAGAANFLEYYASFGRQPWGERLPYRAGGVEAYTRREPIGAVLAITPFNDPLLTPARKLAPALISGNTVILKVAGDSPLAGMHLAAALKDAGLPAGVVNTVTGKVSVIGDALLDSPALAAVSFTGSTAVGHQIGRRLAGRNCRLQTEMGGKNGALVLADADTATAAATIGNAAFAQAGQRCTATSRVVVMDAVFDEFVEKLRAYAAGLVVGAGIADGTQMGPVVNEGHMLDVLRDLDAAVTAGATVVAGVTRVVDEGLDKGCFIAPSVLICPKTSDALWQEEIFGPALAVYRARTEAEAHAAMLDTRYGLSAAVFTNQLDAANRFIDKMDTGQVAINLSTAGWDVHLPFGGFRDSGSSFKEQGQQALQFYTRVKTVAMRYQSH